MCLTDCYNCYVENENHHCEAAKPLENNPEAERTNALRSLARLIAQKHLRIIHPNKENTTEGK
jgi:hypothetical protein